jgi:hypothetical protein
MPRSNKVSVTTYPAVESSSNLDPKSTDFRVCRRIGQLHEKLTLIENKPLFTPATDKLYNRIVALLDRPIDFTSEGSIDHTLQEDSIDSLCQPSVE